MLYLVRKNIVRLLVYLGYNAYTQVFYECYENNRYLTVSIIKYPLGIALLKIGNGIYLQQWCRGGGLQYNNNRTYGYADLKGGKIFFQGGVKYTGVAVNRYSDNGSPSLTTYPFTEQTLRAILADIHFKPDRSVIAQD